MRCVKPLALAAFASILLAWTVAATAQSVEQGGFAPVDRGVEDVSALSRSLRVLPPDLSTGSATVYRRSDDATGDSQKLYFIGQGIAAEYDHSVYATIPDGPTVQLVPPNTVFHIGLPPAEAAPSFFDHPRMLNTRLRHETPPIQRPLRRIEPPTPADLERSEWINYTINRRTEKLKLLESLDRLLQPEARPLQRTGAAGREPNATEKSAPR